METGFTLRATLCAAALALLGGTAFAANPNANQATRMYNRIAGVPPSAAQLAQMIATNDPAFYNGTIRNLATPWTNREQTVFAPLNDYTATVVGMVRDNVPFNTLLSADLIYIADAASGAPAYSPANNDMYQTMDDDNVDLKAHLVSSTQSALTGIPSAATAGVLTTRGAASAFFVNGTNRAMFRFTMMNHLCSDLQTIMDTTRPPDRIRQDVTRSPGGVSTLFLNNCIGCHSGMDPMAQAFAYYNFAYPASEIGVSHQHHEFPAGLLHPGRHLEQPLAHRTERGLGLERGAARQRQRRQVPGARAREFPGVRELPGHPGVQGCVSAGARQRGRRQPGQ